MNQDALTYNEALDYLNQEKKISYLDHNYDNKQIILKTLPYFGFKASKKEFDFWVKSFHLIATINGRRIESNIFQDGSQSSLLYAHPYFTSYPDLHPEEYEYTKTSLDRFLNNRQDYHITRVVSIWDLLGRRGWSTVEERNNVLLHGLKISALRLLNKYDYKFSIYRSAISNGEIVYQRWDENKELLKQMFNDPQTLLELSEVQYLERKFLGLNNDVLDYPLKDMVEEKAPQAPISKKYLHVPLIQEEEEEETIEEPQDSHFAEVGEDGIDILPHLYDLPKFDFSLKKGELPFARIVQPEGKKLKPKERKGKLDDFVCKQIYTMYHGKVPVTKICKRFGVSNMTAYKAIRLVTHYIQQVKKAATAQQEVD